MKKKLKAFYKQILFRLSSANHPLYVGFYKYLYKPKAGSIAAFLDKYSRQTRDFFVVQIGANDGITHDPIHKFIKRDDWNGVLLEPQKWVFENSLRPIYRKNMGIMVAHAALGHEDGSQTMYKIGFSDARWATGLATFQKEILEKAFHSGHVERQTKKENITIPSDPGQQIVEEQVPTLSVKTLMEDYGITKIDLLQIDTEGFDFEIIKMFDLTAIQPGAIVFEHSHLSEADRAACQTHLEKHGYTMKAFGGNSIAVVQELQELL